MIIGRADIDNVDLGGSEVAFYFKALGNIYYGKANLDELTYSDFPAPEQDVISVSGTAQRYFENSDKVSDGIEEIDVTVGIKPHGHYFNDEWETDELEITEVVEVDVMA